METSSDNGSLPPQLIFLKRLVTALGVVMIAGFLVLIAALVIRLNADPLPLPDRITLPEGVTATAFSVYLAWNVAEPLLAGETCGLGVFHARGYIPGNRRGQAITGCT